MHQASAPARLHRTAREHLLSARKYSKCGFRNMIIAASCSFLRLLPPYPPTQHGFRRGRMGVWGRRLKLEMMHVTHLSSFAYNYPAPALRCRPASAPHNLLAAVEGLHDRYFLNSEQCEGMLRGL